MPSGRALRKLFSAFPLHTLRLGVILGPYLGHDQRGVDRRYPKHRMLTMLRYYWMAAKGYRLTPWKSPYLRWRFETFLGPEAAHMDAAKFFRLTWKYRNQLESFLNWAEERRKEQRRSRH